MDRLRKVPLLGSLLLLAGYSVRMARPQFLKPAMIGIIVEHNSERHVQMALRSTAYLRALEEIKGVLEIKYVRHNDSTSIKRAGENVWKTAAALPIPELIPRMFILGANDAAWTTGSLIAPFSAPKLECEELLAKGMDILLTFLSCETLAHPPSTFRALAVPHVAMETEKCTSNLLRADFRERPEDKILALTALIKDIGWKEASIFIDDTLSDRLREKMLQGLSLSYVKSALYRMARERYGKQEFSQFVRNRLMNLTRDGRPKRHFVIALAENGARTVVREAASLYMLMGKIFWVIVSDDITAEDVVSLGANARNAHIVILKKACDRRAAVDLSAANLTSALESITANRDVQSAVLFSVCLHLETLFRQVAHRPTSLLLSQCLPEPSRGTELQVNFSGVVIQAASFNVTKSNCYNGYDVITIRHDSDSETAGAPVARWQPVGGGLTRVDEIFPNVKYGLGNVTLVVTATQLLPYAIKKKGTNSTDFEGLCVSILEEFSKKMNFSYVWKEPPDGQFGHEADDKTWSGLVGLLVRREADLVVAPLTITPSRDKVVDYTHPFSEDMRAILIKRPEDDANDLFKVFRPFTVSSWMAFVASLLLTGFVLAIINGATSLCLDSGSPGILARLDLVESVWSMYTFYMEQGGAMEPRTVSGRLVVGFWWLYTIIITTCYTANLAAFFTVSVPGPSIESLEDLANQDEIQPVTLYGSQMYRQYETSEDEVHKKIFAAFKDEPRVTDGSKSVDIVKSGKYAFITLLLEAKTLAARHCESLTVSKDPFDVMRMGFAMPEGSALLSEFSHRIRIMMEAGLIDRWRNKWIQMKKTCSSSTRKTSADGLGISSLGGVCIVYSSFVLLSVASLLVERFRRNAAG